MLMDTVTIVQQSENDLLEQLDIESLGGTTLFDVIQDDVDVKLESPDTPPLTPVVTSRLQTSTAVSSQSILKPGITSLLTSTSSAAAGASSNVTAARAITFNAQGNRIFTTTNNHVSLVPWLMMSAQLSVKCYTYFMSLSVLA